MPSSPVTKPCLAAAALFAALAALIARLAVAPLSASDLLGIAACAAASGAAATLAFTLRTPATSVLPSATTPAIDADALAVQIAAAVDVRLAASEDRRRDELLRAASTASSQATTPVAGDFPSSAGSKPRLGRGLLGLMQAPSALSRPADADRDAA